MDFCEELIRKVTRTSFIDEDTIKDLARELSQKAGAQALLEIYAVLDDDTLDDASCFKRIEEIVTIFEELGPGGGTRHDFS